MSAESKRITALEQALYAALSASEQYGITADDMRLKAIAGLSLSPNWGWVADESTADAEAELTGAVRVVREKNNGPN
ncbi:hypothetical protein EON09_06305 [Pseudomonas soli]|uniref:hypothetical protein n=1 Tax=Pseudomonas TaxID=286 RepID=UPI0013648DB0|nr:hypothetical protein [Pseudomonas soli]NBK38141.1 hypothetical protein [Pseudomonas soli]WJO19846.1 hypothetical protein LU688_16280 [Pseudomonas soli]